MKQIEMDKIEEILSKNDNDIEKIDELINYLIKTYDEEELFDGIIDLK